MNNNEIGILGAGTFGIALGRMLANNNYDVTIWSHNQTSIDKLLATRKYKNLDNVYIPDSIKFTSNISETVKDKHIIVVAVPSIAVRETMIKAKPYLADQIIVSVAKGFEACTLFTMSEVIEDVLKDKNISVVALSGPTHAEEIAKDLPSTIVSSSKNKDASKIVQDIFMNTCLRVYTNDDILGIELCGALKNIIALATGIATGLGFGDNTRAALITRGMAEIKRLGISMGAKADTFAGLAGIGDLIVTATSNYSRNNRCGILIGQGVNPKDAVKQIGMVVEGLNTLPAAIDLKNKYQVEMPITQMVYDIVNNKVDLKDSVLQLMGRDKKDELI